MKSLKKFANLEYNDKNALNGYLHLIGHNVSLIWNQIYHIASKIVRNQFYHIQHEFRNNVDKEKWRYANLVLLIYNFLYWFWVHRFLEKYDPH